MLFTEYQLKCTNVTNVVQNIYTMAYKSGAIFTFILIVFLSGCQQKNRFNIASFEKPVEEKIHSFDIDFIAIETTDMVNSLKKLEQKYPAFCPVFLADVLMMNPADTLENASQIKDFLKNTAFIKVHQDVKRVFANTDTIESTLSTAYSYLSHYFPNIHLPEIYFFVSGFNRQFLLNKTLLGIGSDLYLGADYPVYKDITYEYLLADMRKEMVAGDILSNILHNEFTFRGNIDLLNAMIYEGKIMYLLSVIMPEESRDNITGFSTENLRWFDKYEDELWKKIIEDKHLFSTDQLLISQYINKAPFSSPVSQESPGRAGCWIGWQIVQSYMQNNKNVGLSELMNTASARFILEKSNYRP